MAHGVVPPGGHQLAGSLNGCRFTVGPVPEGVRVTALPPGLKPQPAVWLVEARGRL
jgi:hypothetical protein